MNIATFNRSQFSACRSGVTMVLIALLAFLGIANSIHSLTNHVGHAHCEHTGERTDEGDEVSTVQSVGHSDQGCAICQSLSVASHFAPVPSFALHEISQTAFQCDAKPNAPHSVQYLQVSPRAPPIS